MTELHLPLGKNRFCGPGALAIVTGLSTDDAARIIREETGKRAVFGVQPRDLQRSFTRAGSPVRPVAAATNQSVERWASAVAELGFTGTYVVYITGHYCVVQIGETDIVVADNKTIYPVPMARYRSRGKRVKEVWKR